MKIVFLLSVLIAWGLSSPPKYIVKYKTMMRQVMKKDVLARYLPYGCYCGQEGQGAPVDATDRCCWKQACCYKNLEDSDCPMEDISYEYMYAHRKIYCEFGVYCNVQSCKCDIATALCLRKNQKTYQNQYRNLTISQCTVKTLSC